jgi:uncharacterized coiled-coil DUF342 family protein
MDENAILDEVVALWKKADEHSDQADLLQREADNQQSMANELEDRAEELWRPLADLHPEWVDALRSAQDPRA